jgi:hypothetical protein
MILVEYLLLWAVAGVATLSWSIGEKRIPMSTLVSTAAWALISVSGGTVTLFFQDGSSTVVGDPVMQYFALGMSVLCSGAFILWYFEAFPPDERGKGLESASEGEMTQ